MNQRIQKLAEQAGYTPLPGFDFANDLQEVFLKKFAELIVRECAKRIDYWESKQGEHSDDLLKHFGVEE